MLGVTDVAEVDWSEEFEEVEPELVCGELVEGAAGVAGVAGTAGVEPPEVGTVTAFASSVTAV